MTTETSARPVDYRFSESVPALLAQHGISLMVTTYQAQLVMAMSATEKGMMTTLRHFERPTGLAVEGNHMAVATRRQIWIFRTTGVLRDLAGQAMPYDRCYAPRQSHVTGDMLAHELAWTDQGLTVVNTRFSCLCTLHADWSFVPVWKPPFVSAVVPEDRCHLNGMAVERGHIRYLTALGSSDTAEGWRPGKASGGVVMAWPSGEIVSSGLSMPHSPRLHGGRLLVLDSGRGELQVVDPQSGGRETIVRFEGYLRGLALHGRHAFVGLCRIREKREFGGVPIEAQGDLRCGIHVVDLERGVTEGVIEFTRGVEELFDIAVVPARNLHVLGMEDDTIDGVFIVPHG